MDTLKLKPREVIRAFRTLLSGFEEQWYHATQQESVSSGSEAEEFQRHSTPQAMKAQLALEEDWENGIPDKKPQLYLCDDWIQPVMVARKPRVMTAKETMKENVRKELSHNDHDVIGVGFWLHH